MGEYAVLPDRGLDTNYNLFFVLVIGTIFISLALATEALRGADPNLAHLATIFTVMGLAGIAFARASLLQGDGAFQHGAVLYVLGHLPFIVLGAVAGGSLAMFSLPTDSYLSMIAQTPPYVQTMFNIFFAPFLENIAIIAPVGVLFIAIEREFGLGTSISLGIAAVMGGLGFAYMHGVRDPVFYVVASGFMILWIVMAIGHDVGVFEHQWGPLLIAATWGMHKGHNMSAADIGLFELWEELYRVPDEVKFEAHTLLALDMLLFAVGTGYLIYLGYVYGRDLF